MRFVYVLYLSYLKIVALNNFNSTDNETKSDKGEFTCYFQVKRLIRQNVQFYTFSVFPRITSLQKAKGEKVAAI